MEPGRELDALIFEKVMGWVILLPGFRDTRDKAIPFYSTDLAAAFTVDKPGWLWEFTESVGTLTVILYTSLEMWRKAIGDYPIFPEDAILVRQIWLDDKAQTYAWLRCLAALKAVGVET